MTNEQYWENRMKASQRLAKNEILDRVKKLYKQAYRTLDRQLLLLWLELLEKNETSVYKATRYKALQEQISNILKSLGDVEITSMEKTLLEVYMQQWLSVNEKAGVAKEWTIINEQAAKQIVLQDYKGACFSDRVWQDMNALRNRLDDTIINSAILGEDVKKVSRRLRNDLNVGYNSCKRLVITETSRVANESCRQAAIDTGMYKTYHILLEPNACEKCTPYRDQHISLDKSVLPLHPYCKCAMIIDLD